MPRTTWIHKAPLIVDRPDYTMELFRRYQKANHLTNAELAPLVGCRNEQAVKDKKARGTDAWKKETVLLWASVLRVPPEELVEAIRLDATHHGLHK